MRSWRFAGLAAGLCAALCGAGTAAALEVRTGIDLDYTYSQEDSGGDVKAATLFNQKYEIKYETSLTTAYDFLGAVRLDLQNGWYTNQAAVSRVAPTLELQTKGSQAAAKIAYEATIGTTDAYHEAAAVTTYSTSLSVDLELTPELWPEVKLKYQRRGDFQDYSKESIADSFEFSTRKDIYGVRLEYNFKWDQTDNVLPARTGSTGTTWSAKATYKEILLGGTEFELAYEINEAYKDERTRGVFSSDTWTFNQVLKTRLKNTLVIAPRLTLGLAWEYQFDQDLLALDFDYKIKNKYVLDLRWDAFDSLKITSEARRETDLTVNVAGEDDERTLTDSFKAGFDYAAISWLRVSGKAEFRSEGKTVANSGGSVDKLEEEKYELIVKNRFGEFWDFTVDASTSIKHTDDWLTNRETRVKGDLKLKLLDLSVTPAYEVSRTTDWEQGIDYPTSQKRVQDARIKFEYQMQLVDMFKATFSHEYGIKVDDNLDEVLNFERLLQFNEDTRLTIVLAEIVRDVRLEGEVDRKASDTEGDPDPQLVELSYALKLDWKYRQLSVLSSIKYNDKGDTFDDVSFNAKAGWKGEQLEVTGEYQFDKIIKDITEPKDEKRKLNIKLSYKF
jgi:hypothetical protein